MLSREVHGIIRHLGNSGVVFKVTDIDTPNVHSLTSYHYRAGTEGNGLAIDAAAPWPTRDSKQLLAIFAAFGAVETQLAELIYSGAPYSIKNGRRVARYGVNAHWDHVHIAVPLGTVLAKEATMPEPEPPANKRIVSCFDYQNGYALVTADGAVYCFNCTYYGGLLWNGTEWVLR